MERQPTYWYRLVCEVEFEADTNVFFTIDLEAYRLPVVGESISVFGPNDIHRLRITELVHPSQHEGELWATLVPHDNGLTPDVLLKNLNEDAPYNNLVGEAWL